MRKLTPHCRFLILMAGLAGGCVATPRPDDPLTPSPRPYAVDVPIPSGFVQVDAASENKARGHARTLRHQYAGKADKTAIREFYRREMPLVRWTPIGEVDDTGRYPLCFERGDETCTVEIVGRGGWSRRVVVNILIDPRRE